MLVEMYSNLNKERANRKLDRYFRTKTLQRLKGKGMFCGMDYVSFEKLKPIEYYSRFNHVKNVGYTASKLSDDLRVQLAGIFHDVGTLSFAHVNSFKRGEALKQDNDELNVKNILLEDEEILTYLSEDGISVDDVSDASKYNLIDKPVPSLCLDRTDGILSTCLIWQHTHTFKKIRNLYNMLGYLENVNGMVVDFHSDRLMDFNGEVVLDEWFPGPSFEDFFAAINVYSKILLSKESRYMMEIFGLMLNYYEDMGIIKNNDLFLFSEIEIINRILESKFKDVWLDVTVLDKIDYVSDLSDELAIVSKVKIRQANPLCMGQMQVSEIHNISGEFYRELNPLYDEIDKINNPIVGNLSVSTKKILSKYKK